MLLGCLPCISPAKAGELKPALLPIDVPENIDEEESRLSFDHHADVGVPPLLIRESNESLRSYKLI